MRYHKALRGKFDAVIDEVNTIPFFAPLWAGVPVFALIWQLAREVWWYESRFPLNAIGYGLEPIYLRAYSATPVFTFSPSTADDLRQLGFRAEVNVVPVGIEQADWAAHAKRRNPTFVYVGRLTPSKRVHEIIEALAIYRLEAGTGFLKLIGNGSTAYVQRLMRLARHLGVADSVEFCGWLRGLAKHQHMAEAHALVMASVREGWGLAVTECNACGTPAIVYDVPGLRDSVRHMETGLVVHPTPRDLAAGMLQLLADSGEYQRIQSTALEWSRSLSYPKSVRIIAERIAAASPVG
jgi:glycosyltransferase involved in cell wall biosynthesis